MNDDAHKGPLKPVVSVIMPTFNDRQVIEAAVNSILQQTFTEWELIIVDDASTDRTSELIESKFDDPRISLIQMQHNSGSGPCRNKAIAAARGDFIAVMDADDVSMPDRLRLQVDRMRAVPNLAAISSQVLEFGKWGGPVLGTWPTSSAEIRLRQKTLRMPVPHPAAMFRKDALLAAGAYDTECRRAQDYSLFLRLSDAHLETLEQPLVMYRTDRPISLTYVLRNEQYADLARLRTRLRAEGVPLEELPREPRKTPRIFLRALRSWLLRNSREQIGLLKDHLMQRVSASEARAS